MVRTLNYAIGGFEAIIIPAMRSRVSVVRCPGYESRELSSSIVTALDLIGGIESVLKPGSKVFVKINHLSPGSAPERAIVTHPLFTREVVRLLKDLNMDVTVGDDIQFEGEDGYLVSGYREMCREMGVRLINLKSEGFREVLCPGGQAIPSVHISAAALDADGIIDLAKLKTHAFTAFTGAVKNMFGVIPCGLRLKYHNRFPRNEVFSRMLVDVFSCLPPVLTLMDAVTAMEGLGPSGGPPRSVGLVLAGRDAVAVDAVAQSIIGFGPDDILTTRYAAERGLGTARLDSIDVVGERFQDVRVDGFRKAAFPVGLLERKLPSAIYAFVSGRLILLPEVAADKCNGCQECFKVCPADAVRMEDGKARILKKPCIHCLCCHEVCRSNAIKLRQRLLGRLVRFFSSVFKIA